LLGGLQFVYESIEIRIEYRSILNNDAPLIRALYEVPIQMPLPKAISTS